jgi:hypothetical protein
MIGLLPLAEPRTSAPSYTWAVSDLPGCCNAFLVVFLVYNWAEAAFKTFRAVWFALYFTAIESEPASRGDTVVVPAGTAIWLRCLT